MKMFNVTITIPSEHRAGETKIYQLQTGPRGGQKWICIDTVYASGVNMPNAQFSPGEYKVTQWVNNWPRIIDRFIVFADGTVLAPEYQ